MDHSPAAQDAKREQAKQQRDSKEAAHLTEANLASLERTAFKNNRPIINRLIQNVREARADATGSRQRYSELLERVKKSKLNAEILDNAPPHDPDAEAAVLGSLLLVPSGIEKVREHLQAEAFYLSDHQEIYRHMLRLDDRKTPIDTLLLVNSLKAAGQLEQVGGAWRIAQILQGCPTAANVWYYVKLVNEMAAKRRLLDLGYWVLFELNKERDAAGVLQELMGKIDAMGAK